MRTKVLLINFLLVFVLGCNLMPPGDAAVFDIGEQIVTDLDNVYPFSSGAYFEISDGEVSLAPSIFDGNLSTGINQIVGDNELNMGLIFVNPIYINNITIKPNFGSGASTYSCRLDVNGLWGRIICQNTAGEKTFTINCYVNGIELTIFPIGVNQYNFNDVIINYTPDASNSTEILKEINDLRNTVNSFQNQIDNFNNQFIDLANKITNLNNTINNFNLSQEQILENITTIWKLYNELNYTIQKLNTEINNLNSIIYRNITQIKSDLIIIEKEISNIHKCIDNLTFDIDQLPSIQNKLNITSQDLFNLNQNFTLLQESIPTAYNDTIMQNKILTLENENANLKTEIINLNIEIENLNTTLNELKVDYDSHEEDKDSEDEVNALIYSGIGLGIIGVIFAIGAIAMLLRRKSPPTMPPEVREGPTNEIAPEQHPIEEPGEIVPQEQIQETPEVQTQENMQMQQQQGIG
jgi:uncharacterized coiled-coil DUF342 family protein